MMVFFQLILSILLQTLTVKSGWLAAGGTYYSCMAACTSGTAAGGLMATVSTAGVAAPAVGGAMLYGAAACATVCSSLAAGTAVLLPGLCFAENTTIETAQFGAITIQQIRPGMNVQAFDVWTNTQIWSEVVINDIINTTQQHHTKISIATHFETNVQIKSIMVTDPHWMIYFGAETENGNNYKLSQAQDLKIGDVIPLIKNESVIRGKIIDIEKIVLPYTYQLGTKSATVIANKVLTTTICDGNAIPYSVVNGSNINTVIKKWKNLHSFK